MIKVLRIRKWGLQDQSSTLMTKVLAYAFALDDAKDDAKNSIDILRAHNNQENGG